MSITHASNNVPFVHISIAVLINVVIQFHYDAQISFLFKSIFFKNQI